ncbi:MAG: winged helix-turn-helix domain-containing protein [Bacteroidetes bacterium]|nr:winged helix-turn-helix domain-containing protein [Bacteroidota bacterium]
MEERRLEGGRLLLAGIMSPADIARHLGVSQVAVAKWKQQLSANGGKLHSLKASRAHGNAPRLSKQQWRAVKAMVIKGAQASGYPNERWTLPRIQESIKHRWGVRYSTGWLSRQLRALGLSVQRPQSKARKKEDVLAEAWLRNDWATIKKNVTTWRHHHVRR